jgi:hypothetical protein
MEVTGIIYVLLNSSQKIVVYIGAALSAVSDTLAIV